MKQCGLVAQNGLQAAPSLHRSEPPFNENAQRSYRRPEQRDRCRVRRFHRQWPCRFSRRTTPGMHLGRRKPILAAEFGPIFAQPVSDSHGPVGRYQACRTSTFCGSP